MCWREIGRPPQVFRRTPVACYDADSRKTILSADRLYRYTLWREWSMPLIDCACGGCQNRKYVMFIGLNPSTADETRDDNTIRKCVKFARSWGYGALCMTNLFAYRATQPKEMKKYSRPIGDDNDKWLAACAHDAGIVIAAWGKDGTHLRRDITVERMMNSLQCLGQNGDGTPKHPLYLKDTTVPEIYSLREPF